MKYLKLILIFSFLFSMTLKPVQAQTQEVESVNDHLTVTPAKFEIWGNKGQSVTQAIKIVNEENEPVILALSVERFVISQKDGSVLLESSNLSGGDPLARWISFQQKGMEFQAKESKIITYKIDIPQNAKSGGYYASIVVSSDKLNKTVNKASATAKVVSLVLLSVTGDIEDSAKITSFKAKKLSPHNVELDLQMKNLGNNHISPKGKFVITNFWGTQIDEVDLDAGTIIPNMSKRLTSNWDPGRWLFGRYTVMLVANYGYQTDLATSASTTFWAVSLPLLIITIILVGGMLYALVKFRGSIKNGLQIMVRLPNKLLKRKTIQ